MGYRFPKDFPLTGKYKRNKERAYSYGEFDDGEQIALAYSAGKPSSTAEGYAWYISAEPDKHQGWYNLINISEVIAD